MGDHNTGYTQPTEPQKCNQHLLHDDDHLHENFELLSRSLTISIDEIQQCY